LGAKIKLQRQGTKNKPFYRIVVQDESFPRNGRVIETIGQYDPNKEPSVFTVNKEKIAAWLSKGAQPTEKLRILLGKAGILPAIDLAALPKKRSKAAIKAGGEEKPVEAPAKVEEAAAPAA
jgi:small subunit ribosomal protein S16